MRAIPLSQTGKKRGLYEVLVDDDDYEHLIQWKWSVLEVKNKRYAVRRQRVGGKQRFIFMHRQILGINNGEKVDIDHLNGDGLDNRRENLRVVSHQENTFNRPEAKGYSWHARYKRYRAQIGVSGKQVFLGYYDDPLAARAAYLDAKKRLHVIRGNRSCVV